MRPLLLLVLASCGSSYYQTNGEVWDAAGVEATTDGLYVRLPASGGLALVEPDGTYAPVDVGEARVTGISASPDQATIGVFLERYRCDTDEDDLKKVEVPGDCPSQDLDVLPELALVSGGEVSASAVVDGPYNAIAWSPSGRKAVAWLDLDDLGTVKGVVNLNGVVVLDVEQGTSDVVSVGFSASDVLFDEAHDRAVVLSQSSVAVIDLASTPPQREVTFQLTLDPDSVVIPVGVELTPDGRYALISVQGKGDLYVLDLETHSVNIVSLVAPPSAMHVDADADRTVLVYAGSPRVEILDHDRFELVTETLDEAMTNIADAGPYVLLYRPGAQDVYRLDPVTGDVVEFRLEGPLGSLEVAPTNELAVVFTAENTFGDRPGMEILDLRDDKGRSSTWLLEGRGVGVAFAQGDQTLHALVLQAGTDYLHELDLYAAEGRNVELDAAPLGIGQIPGGGFWITHQAGLGLISFLEPGADEPTQAAGFGTLGLLDPIEVLAPEEE